MNYNILRYVLAVAEEKNFTRAAKKLYISQPSLSQIIKSEEEKLGFLLFDRSTSPIELTDGGREYILWAQNILSIHEKMNRRLQCFSSNKAPVIRLGILPECSTFILASPLKLFLEKNPDAFVQINELSSNDLHASLENRELDFIIGLTHTDTYKYCNEPLYNENIVIATSSQYPLINENTREIDLAQLSDTPFVTMNKNQFLFNLTHDLCNRNGFVPKTVVECYNLETAISMVQFGVGVSLMPDLICNIMGGLDYFQIKDETPKSQISIVYAKDICLDNSSQQLINLIKNNINENAVNMNK